MTRIDRPYHRTGKVRSAELYGSNEVPPPPLSPPPDVFSVISIMLSSALVSTGPFVSAKGIAGCSGTALLSHPAGWYGFFLNGSGLGLCRCFMARNGVSLPGTDRGGCWLWSRTQRGSVRPGSSPDWKWWPRRTSSTRPLKRPAIPSVRGDRGGVGRCPMSGPAQGCSNPCFPVAARSRRPDGRSVNPLPLSVGTVRISGGHARSGSRGKRLAPAADFAGKTRTDTHRAARSTATKGWRRAVPSFIRGRYFTSIWT